MSAKVMKGPDGWQPVATHEHPLRLKLPNGQWRTYGGGLGVPLKQKQPDGTWKVVGKEGTESAALWYVMSDIPQAPGELVRSGIPARIGAPMATTDTYEPYPARVSADAIPALEFRQPDQYLVYYEEDRWATGEYVEHVDLGITHGFTLYMVIALPPFQLGAGTPIGMVDFWIQSDTFRGGVLEVTLRNDVSGPHMIVLTGDFDGESDFGPAVDGGPLTSGSLQVVEVRCAANASVRDARIGGVDLPLTDVWGAPMEDLLIRGPAIGLGGVSSDGGYTVHSAKLWELKMFPFELTGDDLVAQRAYFSTKYGVPA